jgi:hypothetical protein
MKTDQSRAAGLEATSRAVDALDVETLRTVLRNVIRSVHNHRGGPGLSANVVADLEGYDLLPYVAGEEESEFVAWTDSYFFWHDHCIELNEDDVEFRGLTADEAASCRHAEQRCDTCGLPLAGNRNVSGS